MAFLLIPRNSVRRLDVNYCSRQDSHRSCAQRRAQSAGIVAVVARQEREPGVTATGTDTGNAEILFPRVLFYHWGDIPGEVASGAVAIRSYRSTGRDDHSFFSVVT